MTIQALGNLPTKVPSTRLTDRAIKSAMDAINGGGVGRIELKDPAEYGVGRLVLILSRLTNGISCGWYVHWHREGKRRAAKIGMYPTMTLAEARQVFRVEYAPAIQKGQNPIGPRSAARRRGHSLKDMFEAYVVHLEEAGRPAAYHARRLLLGPKGAVHALGGSRPPSEILPADIVPFLAKVHSRGTITEANSAHAYIRAAFNFAIKSVNSYHVPGSGQDWGLTSNPAARIPVNKLAFRARDRALSLEEVRTFWFWLVDRDKEVRCRMAPALRLMLATGQRPGEILQIGPAHWDQRTGLLEWRKTKNGRQHAIPLPKQAVEILTKLKPNEHGHFFARQFYPEQTAKTYGGGALIRRFIRETGAEPFTMRDLRRTWKTEAGAAGIAKDVRDRIQNHAATDVSTRHYDRWSYMPEKRAAMGVWENHLDKILDGSLEGSRWQPLAE